MKKTIVVALFIVAGLFASNNTSAQTCVQTIASSDFGGAAGTMNGQITYTVPASGNFGVFYSNSLCGSTGFVLTVKVGNKRIFRGKVQNGGAPVTFTAKAGQTITVTGVPSKVDPNIMCVWEGIANITLCVTE